MPVTSAPLVYLTDHPPGCGLDIVKGPLITSTNNQHHQRTATTGMRQDTGSLGKEAGRIYFRRRVTCISHALSRVLDAGALLK